MSNPVTNPKDLRVRVKELVEQSGTQVVDGVVTKLVEEEVGKRKELIVKALGQLDQMQRDLQKIKPDQTQYAVEAGQVKSIGEGTFSKEKAEEKVKAEAQIKKLEEALEKAFAGDYQKLKDLVK